MNTEEHIKAGDSVVVLLLNNDMIRGEIIYRDSTGWLLKHKDGSVYYLSNYQYICRTTAII